MIRVSSPHGIEIPVRALLDTGSECSFITNSLAHLLHLSRTRINVPLTGIGAHPTGHIRNAVTLVVKPHFDSGFSCVVDALVLPKLTADLPSHDCHPEEWNHLTGLPLADPDFSSSRRIEVILGADIYGHLLDDGVAHGSPDSPIAHATKLGWVLSGTTSPRGADESPRNPQVMQCSLDQQQVTDLLESIERFWLQEEVPSRKNAVLSPEDETCEKHFVSTHARDASGRYIVRLPFQASVDTLGNSRSKAARMLTRMHTCFATNSELRNLYCKFLGEYEQLEHMHRVDNATPEPQHAFYLPHHGVLKESSTSTKLRVVFNGSARSTSGVSLNDLLYVGAKLQTDLSEVILRWRRYQFVFGADIEKMFRQILMHEDDWKYQRILWAPDSCQSPTVFELKTVTYGLGPAPFLAIRVLQQLASDEEHRFPLAAKIIRHSTYVDDTFGGADTLPEAQEAVRQLDGLCTVGGFHLMKWTANYSLILSELATERRATAAPLVIDGHPQFKALGIAWEPDHDTFRFSMRPVENSQASKRTVLSRIAQLFDPLGWLAPVVITAKILMQDLWRIQAGWDDPLPDTLLQRWIGFQEQLTEISQLTVPRWLGISSDTSPVEIHGFADALQFAMAAVIYIRVPHDLDNAHIALVCSKTKVAPLKKMTIPRLELAAVSLLVRQVTQIQRVLNLTQAPVHLWTDSMDALLWVKGHPSKWKDYIGNRVALIQDAVPEARWHHVPGTDNPADCATRGVTPIQLRDHALWWTGPTWLSRHSTRWPSSTGIPSPDFSCEERSKTTNLVTVTTPQMSWDLPEHLSSLTRLVRLTAICRRVFFSKRNLRLYPLLPVELERERLFWIKEVQQVYFKSEITTLIAKRSLKSSDPLSKFIPYLDDTGLLRVGGRLRNSFLDPDAKHPLLIPKSSGLTRLLIADAHNRTLHGGTQTTLAYLRRSYWILGGRTPVRSYILRCVICARHRGITAQQLMGQLPAFRSTPARPFTHTGIDYAGPLTLKTWRGRNAKSYKSYIAVFVCLSSSAVHLEAVTDYSAEGFIAAFHRFTGRRGICSTLVSDCGTNLVGADAELRKLFSQNSAELDKLSALLANDGTEWRFNPPSAPHFGGKWEAGVKSVKFHLRRIIGDHLLTFEELSTLLVQIEAVLNSRPLCPLSEDPTDVEALTPGHFLIGSALKTIPEPSVSDLPINRLSRWQLRRQMLESFWSRWSKEYLQRFLAVSKWKSVTAPLQVGSLVLISDERYPPSKWPLARITELHPGQDGLTRVVTLKTATSSYTRPIVKLCPLPVLPASE